MPKQPEIFQRSLSVSGFEKKRMDGEDSPEVYEFKLSSDQPVEIWRDEMEILSHGDGAVRMDFVASGNAPLLWMHRRDEHRGVIDSARIEGGNMTVAVRFGESDEAQALKRDVDAGIIKNVSVGYRVHAWTHTNRSDDGVDTYTVTDWEPLEASFVTIPADASVGIGRSRSYADLLSEDNESAKPEEQEKRRSQITTPNTMPAEAPDVPKMDIDKERGDAAAQERKRAASIQKRAAEIKVGDLDFRGLADTHIEEGRSLEEFNNAALEKIRENAPKLGQASIGASEKDQKRYDLGKVIEGLRTGDMERHAPYEMEMSNALKKRMNKGGSTIAIPHDVLLRGWVPNERLAASYGISARDLQSVTLSGANQSNTVANIVDTELLDTMFVESLRENSVLLNMGVTMVPGLVGDADIPVELLNPTGEWIGEDGVPAEGNYGLGVVGFRFKTLGFSIPFTRRSDKQSTPAINGLLTRSLRKSAALDLERALINGPGTTTEPGGILNTLGVGTVAGGAHTRDGLISLRQTLGNANAAGVNKRIIMNEQEAGEYAKVPISADSDRFVGEYLDDNRLRTPVGVSDLTNLVPDSNVIYGDPSALYVGTWGTMELDLDTTSKRDSGGKVIRIFLDADTAIPQPAKFAIINSFV